MTEGASQATLTRTPRGSQSTSNSFSRSTSTYPIKTGSLREIYEPGTPNSFSLFTLFSQKDDPLTFEEAVEDELWAQAMDEEIECTLKNQTWELVDVPKDKDVINAERIYKTKQDVDGNVQKHKERIIARGFT